MAKASDNEFPKVIIKEGSAPSSPASGDQALFIDSADHKLKRKNSSGTVTTIESGLGGNVEDMSTAEMDTTKVLAPDGAGGLVFRAETGGGSSPYYLDTIALDGTYGDHFTAATLDAKWTRRNLTSSDDIRQSAGGTWLRTTLTNANADEMYLQSAPAGDWEIQCKIARLSGIAASMFAIVAVDASGNGCCFMFYNDNNAYIGSLSSYQWGSIGSALTNYGWLPQYGATVWLSLARVGTNYVGRISYDGSNWSKPTAAVSYANTIDRFGFGRVFGAISGEVMAVDWFNKL